MAVCRCLRADEQHRRPPLGQRAHLKPERGDERAGERDELTCTAWFFFHNQQDFLSSCLPPPSLSTSTANTINIAIAACRQINPVLRKVGERERERKKKQKQKQKPHFRVTRRHSCATTAAPANRHILPRPAAVCSRVPRFHHHSQTSVVRSQERSSLSLLSSLPVNSSSHVRHTNGLQKFSTTSHRASSEEEGRETVSGSLVLVDWMVDSFCVFILLLFILNSC